jgi:two-component system, LytTR family, sensor histidine kinase AlgZ
MTTALATNAPGRPASGWSRTLAIVAFNVLLWSVLSALVALDFLNDDLRRGLHGDYWLILLATSRMSMVLAGLSFIIYQCLSRWPKFVSNAKFILLGYGLMLMLLLPFQFIFLVKLYLREDGPGLSWAAIEQQVNALDKFTSLLGLSSISAVYIAVVAVKVWQQSQIRARAWAQAHADGLAVRLELERQRGLALRAQLEPHFMFNALNAISALVRCDDKDVALDGIDGLSDLLRYALSAGERNWVKFSEELVFVEDYLSLQRLRYGTRLGIVIEGASAAVRDCDCPPLLLQPLVENALRHDLDCHENASDIRLSLACSDGQLFIHISNRVHREAAHNPGVGLGLRNITARLQLAYGTAASMHAGVSGERFEVDIRMPQHAPE